MIIIPISGLVAPLLSQDQSSCTIQLNTAEQYYTSGKFDDAILLIKQCVNNSNITEQEETRAYHLLGLTYLAKDYLEEAKSALEKLLELVPDYKPDPVQDPPSIIPIINEIRAEKQKLEEEKRMREKQAQKEKAETETAGKKGGSKK